MNVWPDGVKSGSNTGYDQVIMYMWESYKITYIHTMYHIKKVRMGNRTMVVSHVDFQGNVEDIIFHEYNILRSTIYLFKQNHDTILRVHNANENKEIVR